MLTLFNQFEAKFLPLFYRDRGRWPSFSFIAEYLLEKNRPIKIIETGTARIKGNWEGDGQSTLMWDWIIDKTNGIGISLDINEENCRIAREQVKNIKVICTDSVPFLRAFQPANEIDLLYLDSYDWDYGEKHIASCLHHITELGCVWEKLPSGCLVCVDDCHSDEDGKHVMVKNFFEMQRQKPLCKGYVTVWRKP